MRIPAFPDYPDRCGWSAMLPPRMPRPPAEGRIAAQYAVVGAGYTGLAVARRLAELDPSAEIIVLEATSVSEGSAARNSGFVSPREVPSTPDEAEIRHCAALNRFVGEGFDWLMALMERHGFECGLEHSGRFKGAATEAGGAVVRSMRDAAVAAGMGHEFLDADGLRERIGTSYYHSGFYTDVGYVLQPAALIHGLADSLPANVRLHEGSPVLSLERDGGWRLRTPAAEITAPMVVLANNGFVRHFGYLRDRLVTIYTYAGITEAMTPADAAHLGAKSFWGLLPSHRLGTTVRRVGPDRLMVRSLYAYERGLPAGEVRSALRDSFHRRYPELAHVDLEHVWGGTTALTMNGSPWWGRLDEGLYTSAGCNGYGIAKGTVLGKRLAEMIAGTEDGVALRDVYGTANWVAPEPFRRIGFKVISTIERRKAGLER